MCPDAPGRGSRCQRGAALITAVFVITALALIGALTVKLTVSNTETTSREWLSAQALYAAETGIDWAAYDIANGDISDACETATCDVVTGLSRFQVTITATNHGSKTVYNITSVGSAGSGDFRTQRRLSVVFMP